MSPRKNCRSAASARPAWAPITATTASCEFSHRKAVFQQLKKDIAPMLGLRPPYGEGIRKYLAGQIKR